MKAMTKNRQIARSCKIECRFWCGAFKYIAIPDKSAGKKNRYTALVLSGNDPIVFGRELDLKNIKLIIAEIEADAATLNHWFPNQARRSVDRVMIRRRAKPA